MLNIWILTNNNIYLQSNKQTILIMEDRLVTINTYSKLINRSKERVRQKVHSGEIPSKVIDGVIFVVLTDREVELRKEERK